MSEVTLQEALDNLTWAFLNELNFRNILYSVNVDKIFVVIYRFLENKLKSQELSIENINDIADNIRAKAKVLFNLIGDDWGCGDDGCNDISTAAVAFGKENYEKCLSDHNYLVSMKKATRQYENVLYPFNEIINKYKNNQ